MKKFGRVYKDMQGQPPVRRNLGPAGNGGIRRAGRLLFAAFHPASGTCALPRPVRSRCDHHGRTSHTCQPPSYRGTYRLTHRHPVTAVAHPGSAPVFPFGWGIAGGAA